MSEIYLYTFVSVIIVSVISLIGIFAIGLNDKWLNRGLHYLISFSAGALLGDVFLHLIPELSEDGFSPMIGMYFVVGVIIFFLLEKYILWHHSHDGHDEKIHATGYLTIFGDALHNFIDGLIIAASFLASIPLGIATTIAVVFHEIPQEIGQFGILVHGGWSKGKALLYNFISALTAIVGAAIVLFITPDLETAPTFLLAFAGASFIYIAMSDIIPDLHKEKSVVKSIWQIVAFVIGIAVMWLLLMFE
jgi:zinc and cadmium transporter